MARTPETLERLPLGENAPGQGLVLLTLAMLAMGVIMVNSAMIRPVSRAVEWYARTDVRHTMYAIISAFILLTVWRLDYHKLAGRRSTWLGGAGIFLVLSLLAAVAVVTISGLGQKESDYSRWLRIGPSWMKLTFQPSEFVKFALVIFLATWLGRPEVNPKSFFKTFVPAMMVIGISVGAIVTDDFSVGAVAGLAGMIVLLLAGVPWYYLALVIPPAAAACYKLVYCDPYRWPRVTAFLNPMATDNPCTYQARESLTAIATGGWTGKGLGMGTVKLGYVPEGSTDFIFSVFCEEWGYVGALLLMGMVFMWIWHARKGALKAPDRMGMLLVGSLGFLIALQSVVNIAVALSVAPTSGMGLPFVSAGGTSLIITGAAVALMVSVTARRKPEGLPVEPTADAVA